MCFSCCRFGCFAAVALGSLYIEGQTEKTAGDAPSGATANEIMVQVREVYASASSYLDEGQVTTIHGEGAVARAVREELEFSTAFQRPNRYRYRQGYPGSNFQPLIVWSDGTAFIVFSWGHSPSGPEVKENSLADANRFASKGSGDAAGIILHLLDPDCTRSGCEAFRATKRLPDATVDGAPCFVIEGRTNYGDEVTLWIETDTKLIRKTESVPASPFTSLTTTVRHPRINEPIPAERLAYDPPAIDGFAGLLQSDYLAICYEAPWFVRGMGLATAAVGLFYVVRRMRDKRSKRERRFPLLVHRWNVRQSLAITGIVVANMMIIQVTGSVWVAWILIAMVGAVFVWRFRLDDRLHRRLAACGNSLCDCCGYELRGLPDHHECPECGAAYDLSVLSSEWDGHRKTASKDWRNMVIGMAITLLVIGLARWGIR